jgi:hypothetical protein
MLIRTGFGQDKNAANSKKRPNQKNRQTGSISYQTHQSENGQSIPEEIQNQAPDPQRPRPEMSIEIFHFIHHPSRLKI